MRSYNTLHTNAHNMKKVLFFLALGSFILTGCPEHEVIPAPTPKVDLEATFVGTINGSPVELTKKVDGYVIDANKTKVILPSPTPSYAVYSSEMKSGQSLVSIKVSLGAVTFDGGVSQDPAVEVFNNFMLSNTLPSYSAGALAGFEVVYRDGTGNIWTSDEASTPQDVEFTNIIQESDNTGDYSKFICTFNCMVYRSYTDINGDLITLSLPIQDAVFTSYFKR